VCWTASGGGSFALWSVLHPNSASRANKATFIVTWNHYLLKNIACFTHIRFIGQIRRNKLSSKTSPHGLTRHEFAFLPLSLLVWVKHTMQIDKLLRLHTAKVRLLPLPLLVWAKHKLYTSTPQTKIELSPRFPHRTMDAPCPHKS